MSLSTFWDRYGTVLDNLEAKKHEHTLHYFVPSEPGFVSTQCRWRYSIALYSSCTMAMRKPWRFISPRVTSSIRLPCARSAAPQRIWRCENCERNSRGTSLGRAQSKKSTFLARDKLPAVTQITTWANTKLETYMLAPALRALTPGEFPRPYEPCRTAPSAGLEFPALARSRRLIHRH